RYVVRQTAITARIREGPRQCSPHAIEVSTHAPRGGMIDGTAFECRIAHQAASAVAACGNHTEHSFEERADLWRGSPHGVERPNHRVHHGLRIALEAREEQVPFAAEGRVQSVAAGAGATHELVEPGCGIPAAPEQLHGAVERLGGLECLGPWHAPPI